MKNEVFYQLKKGEGSQLICFPYLGGYANSFLELANILGNDVEVWSSNAPGHGASSSPPLQKIHNLLDLYYKELQAIIKPQCIFFGHSMGGIVAYFLMQKIINSDLYPIKPMALVLSACNSPFYFNNKNISALSNEDLIEHLTSYGGIPDEIIKENSLLDYFLPVYRADFMILESAAVCDYKPLNIPVYYLWGERDKIVSIDEVIKWSKYFASEMNLIPIEEGSHMFIADKVTVVKESLENIFNDINQQLS